MVRLVAWLMAAAGLGAAATQQPPLRSAWEGVYTEAQAARGQALYQRRCAKCHLADLTGAAVAGGADGEVPAPLIGPVFLDRWNNQTVGALFDTVRRTMPQDTPASLNPQAYADLASYLLKMNAMPAGQSELPADVDTLQTIRVTEQRPQ